MENAIFSPVLYVFEVKESISDIYTELPCSRDLEILGQLPVLLPIFALIADIVALVASISAISTYFMFSRSRNPFLAVSQSYHVQVTSKIQVNFRFYRSSRVLMIGSHGFSKFLYSLRFRGQEIHFSQFHKATMFEWPRKSRSTSGFTGPQGYWWLGLIDFRNFFIPYVFEVKESISRSFTKLICLSDLENSGQLPVSQVFKSTDDWVLWILEISLFPTFLRSRNPFPAVSQSYYVRVTSKI